MDQLKHKLLNRNLRKQRVRAVVSGTSERPRLTVFISNLHVSAQVIDDTKSVTLAASTTVGNKQVKGTMTEQAAWVGADIAKKAKAKKIKLVAFDRSGRQYHGRLKALAEAARQNGLEF
jgi:large subunit ribosomal protein L18